MTPWRLIAAPVAVVLAGCARILRARQVAAEPFESGSATDIEWLGHRYRVEVHVNTPPGCWPVDVVSLAQIGCEGERCLPPPRLPPRYIEICIEAEGLAGFHVWRRRESLSHSDPDGGFSVRHCYRHCQGDSVSDGAPPLSGAQDFPIKGKVRWPGPLPRHRVRHLPNGNPPAQPVHLLDENDDVVAGLPADRRHNGP